MNLVAEHPRHHTITAKEMDLKAMCLLLCARFRVDSADVFFRLRIGTFSSWHKLTNEKLTSHRQISTSH
ncbi:MAG: hypothetical protein DMF05_01315 [Verrucomicrobia bacterium]|nr:MAG: hypothetical protein DMF05_01315 [Verrucomicrobiota bacterium]